MRFGAGGHGRAYCTSERCTFVVAFPNSDAARSRRRDVREYPRYIMLLGIDDTFM